MNVSDVALIAATLLGPVFAVQAQKFVERATESRRQRLLIFGTIMANRATRLADENIKALNAIDLVFRQRLIPSKKDTAVRDAWHSLFGELTQGLADNPDNETVKRWNERCNDLYVRLESAMAKALGYRFTEEQLRRGIYYPRGHNERERAQLAILHNTNALLEGKSALNMKVTELPGSPESNALQAKVLASLSRAYTDEGALKISIVSGEIPKAEGS